MHRSKLPVSILAVASLLLLILAAPGFAPAARAQSSDWSISFGSGFAKPEGGAFGAIWKRGTPIVLAMAGQMSPHFELGGEFGFVKFKPGQDSTLIPGVRGGDTDWEMWRLRFRARRFLVSPDAKIAPFVLAGVGIYPISAQSQDSTGTLKVTQTANGVSIGGGADFRAGDTVGFGLEGQYHYIRTNREILGYKASPMLEVLFVIRWIPGGGPGP
ncbi:MAG TPA: outer membrane beta-barrel protein [Candidatus Binatia bacterium]|nr:outer membrane beta-barrel protein [Candidatus Binatia bacterium]